MKERVISIEERVAWAVDNYRASLTFNVEIFEDSIEAYQFEFIDYKEAVLTHFLDLDITFIEILAIEEGDAPPPTKDVATLEAPLAPKAFHRSPLCINILATNQLLKGFPPIF